MNNECIHPNCNSKGLFIYPNGLCSFHKEELETSGKPGHWACSWCEQYKSRKGATI